MQALGLQVGVLFECLSWIHMQPNPLHDVATILSVEVHCGYTLRLSQPLLHRLIIGLSAAYCYSAVRSCRVA